MPESEVGMDKLQEDRFRVGLFKTRYKILDGQGLSDDERFITAIAETADHIIKLADHPEIVSEWIRLYCKHQPPQESEV